MGAIMPNQIRMLLLVCFVLYQVTNGTVACGKLGTVAEFKKTQRDSVGQAFNLARVQVADLSIPEEEVFIEAGSAGLFAAVCSVCLSLRMWRTRRLHEIKHLEKVISEGCEEAGHLREGQAEDDLITYIIIFITIIIIDACWIPVITFILPHLTKYCLSARYERWLKSQVNPSKQEFLSEDLDRGEVTEKQIEVETAISTKVQKTNNQPAESTDRVTPEEDSTVLCYPAGSEYFLHDKETNVAKCPLPDPLECQISTRGTQPIPNSTALKQGWKPLEPGEGKRTHLNWLRLECSPSKTRTEPSVSIARYL